MNHWPVTLRHGDVALRPMKWSDSAAWREVRIRNAAWLREWEATLPAEAKAEGERLPTFGQMLRRMRHEARAGRALPWVVTVLDRLAGQVTVGGIAYGSLRSAYLGYWIDERESGRGVMTTAVALASDYCRNELGLHRLELNIRPENEASLALARRCGYRFEGERAGYLHINGDWRDHVTYVLFAGDLPGGVLAHVTAHDTPK